MKKIKILQFPIASSYGGITHYALNNWFHMDKEKFLCDFATMSKHLGFEDEILKTGSKVFYISCYAEDDEERFRMEFSNILDEGYDVVHLHTKQWKSFLAEEICKQKGVKRVIIHAHSTKCDNNDATMREIETKRHFEVRNQLSESIATDFWACSKMAADWLFGPQISYEKIRIMHNAINTEQFLFNTSIRESKRRELGIGQGTFVIGNVGRLCYQKNQELLIRAYSEAFGNDAQYLLLIIGDGPMMDEYEKLVDTLGILNNVRFLGYRDDTALLYQAIDLFVLTSRFEGLPISAIEAQCAGLKCLINKTISDEVIITNNCLWLDDTISDWSVKLVQNAKVYERKNMRAEIKKAGYDIDEQIKSIEEMYLN